MFPLEQGNDQRSRFVIGSGLNFEHVRVIPQFLGAHKIDLNRPGIPVDAFV